LPGLEVFGLVFKPIDVSEINASQLLPSPTPAIVLLIRNWCWDKFVLGFGIGLDCRFMIFIFWVNILQMQDNKINQKGKFTQNTNALFYLHPLIYKYKKCF
jgi:hypothetical protein